MENTLTLYRNGAVGFIDWLDGLCNAPHAGLTKPLGNFPDEIPLNSAKDTAGKTRKNHEINNRTPITWHDPPYEWR